MLILFFYPYSSKITNTETVYFSIIGLEIKHYEVFATILVGTLTVFGVLYETDKNFKAMKLSLIPDNSMSLLLNLKIIFKEENDNFKLILKIMEYWSKHQKTFLLLTPNFYKKFLDLITKYESVNKFDKIHEKNAKYIINAITAYITNSALNDDPFIFIRPRFIDDDLVIEENGEINKFYGKIEFTNDALTEYINNISGKNTKKSTSKKFKKLKCSINTLMHDLEKELDEYL